MLPGDLNYRNHLNDLYDLNDLAHRALRPGLDLYYTDPAKHTMTRQMYDPYDLPINDLDRDLHDMCFTFHLAPNFDGRWHGSVCARGGRRLAEQIASIWCSSGVYPPVFFVMLGALVVNV